MKLFEIKTPDGRYIRHHHGSIDAAKKAMQPGYEVSGEVIGARGDASGGFVELTGEDAKPILAVLLATGGAALAEWLDANGYKKASK